MGLDLQPLWTQDEARLSQKAEQIKVTSEPSLEADG